MKLKTAEHILLSACALMLVFFFIGSKTQNHILILAGITVAFASAAFWIIFGRCPNCGKHLGREPGKYCPHCGEKLE